MTKFINTIEPSQIPENLVKNLTERFGSTANIQPAKAPEQGAKTNAGNDLKTNYKGNIVGVSDEFIAQRVDTGGNKTNIVIHDRNALSVPPKKATGEMPAIASKFAEGKVNGFDVTISYDASKKGELYARDRKMDEIQLAANTLSKHSGLDGAKQATFEKNLVTSVSNFKEVHYENLRKQADAFKDRETRQSQAHNIVGQERGAR